MKQKRGFFKIIFFFLLSLSFVSSFVFAIGIIEANPARAAIIQKCGAGLEGDGTPELPCHFPGSTVGMDSSCTPYTYVISAWIEDQDSNGVTLENPDDPSQRMICDGTTVQIQDDHSSPSVPPPDAETSDSSDLDQTAITPHSSSMQSASNTNSNPQTTPSHSNLIDEAWLKFAHLTNPALVNKVWTSNGWQQYVPPQSSSSSSSYIGSSSTGTCFPLAQNSLRRISYNWGNARDSGARCHAGVDIITQGDGTVVAIDDGIVTQVIRSFYTCSGGPSGAIMIYHPSLGKTANYGEINSGDIRVNIGDRINKGQILGHATACGMLHFELYDGQISTNQRWKPTAGSTVQQTQHYCVDNFQATKPSSLANPEILIRSLEGRYCGAASQSNAQNPQLTTPITPGSLQGTPNIISSSQDPSTITAKNKWQQALTTTNIAGKTWIVKLPANGANDNYHREDTGRNTIIFQPNPQATGTVDLIYFFHGIYGFNSDMAERVIPQAKEIAERGGNVIIAFPELPWSAGENEVLRSTNRQRMAWNGVDSDFSDFHSQVISTIRSQVGVNQINRVFIVGHSAGGAGLKFTAVNVDGTPKDDLDQVHPTVITCSDCDYAWGSPSVVRTVYEQYIQTTPNTRMYMMVQEPSRPSAHEPTLYSIALSQRIGGTATQSWSYQQSPRVYNTPGATPNNIFDVIPNVHYVPLAKSHAQIGAKSIVYSYYPELIGTS